MRIQLFSMILIASLVSATGAQAASKKSAKRSSKRTTVASTGASAAGSTSPKKVSTDIRFSGSQVDGKYLSAGESIAEVEGEKKMGTLIGIRKNFRDKLNAENARLASGKGL